MKDESRCKALLEGIIRSLDARCQTPHGDANARVSLLNFILAVSFHLHEANRWDKCRYWVDRRFGLAITMHGLRSLEARKH